MSTVAEHVPFLHLCKLCQKISEAKGMDKKTHPLGEFIQYWRQFSGKLHSNDNNTTDSFFPAMRLLLPHLERQRAAYGIKEFTLAKLLIQIFCLDKNSGDAQKLIHYKSPKSANADAGDFASVAYFVLKHRSPEKGTLTVFVINKYLDSIAANHEAKNKDELQHDLLYLFRNTSAMEQKWLIRMILKDMKLGISENTVFKVFHQDASELFNVTNSLEKVCCSLKDPSIRLHEIEISLFSAFRPMLAEMAHPNQVEQLLKKNSFLIETKFDGERLQLHKDGTNYMYFSRGGFDTTSTYGNSPTSGNLTPHIHKSFKSGVKNCILDGEIVIYSNKLNCIVSKGANADFQALESDGEYEPCYCVYDILLLNDRVLSNRPLSERVLEIRNTFDPIENKIRYTEQLNASTNAEVTEELNKAIDQRLEGIVVKDPDSVYKPNIRKGGGWLKVKPEYVDNVMAELDLLIIGGYYGSGRRSSIISHFLLAVASNEQKDGTPACFYSFCKVGSGYSYRDLHELTGKLGEHWQPYDPKKPVSHVIIGGGRKEQPDLWIEPSKSVIVQVKATEIVRSKSFATDCTLRFPRVEKIRYDKPWRDCMTRQEMDDLRNMAQGSLASKGMVSSEDEPSPKKPRVQRERTATVAPHFRPTNTSDIKQETSIFFESEMCAVCASLEKKQEMERLIVAHGGTFVQNPGNNTFCILVDKVTAKASNLIRTDQYDVIKCDWVLKCVRESKFLRWVPDDVIYATEETREKMAEYHDRYGDSYTEDLDEATLRKIFNEIPQEIIEDREMTSEMISSLDKKYFPGTSEYGIFRDCWINIKDSSLDETNLEWLSLKLRLYGANICQSIDEKTTHVIVPPGARNDAEEEFKSKSDKPVQVVTQQWVEECIRQKRVLEEVPHSVDEESSSGSLF